MSDPMDLKGWTFVHSMEAYDDEFLGIRIFVKLSRPLQTDSGSDDMKAVRRAAHTLEDGLRWSTARRDPKGPVWRQVYRDESAQAFASAGLAPIFVEEIPNEYCSRPCCLNRPWFLVTSPIGHIKIGWRKSVINIDWSRSVVKKSGMELFPDENVTRGDARDDGGGRFIHAGGIDVAIRYLKVLSAAAEGA